MTFLTIAQADPETGSHFSGLRVNLDYHASPEDAARAAEAARAGHLAYYHIVPPLPVDLMETVFLGDSKSQFSGPISIGKDGLLFSLPAGSDEIGLEQVF
jgi:ribonuclease Z